MASDAQIRANRANSKKSSGPRSQTGKANSSRNATTHNITGVASLRSGPEKDAFDAYFNRLIPDFDCHTDLEHELASRVIDVMFRLARISTLEANIFAAGTTSEATSDASRDNALGQAKTFINESRTFSNLSLYEQRLSRTLRNDLATLSQLRSPTKQKGLAAPPRPTVIRWVDEDGNDTLSPIPIAPIGFVFSSPKTGPAPPGMAAQNALNI